MSESNVKFSEAEAIDFHARGRPGKIEIIASKPMATQRDLSLAYSPGVAVPVEEIAANPDRAYDLTAKGNLVAVISNGTAILGLGNLGALASKPVMEGKAVLFKRFADVDSIDIEVATEDPQRFIDAVELMEPTFGGINLEDIKAPECFIIEQTLSWDDPLLTTRVNGLAALTLMDAARRLQERRGREVRVLQPSSAEIFGEPAASPQDERTPIRPVSPYGASKAFAHHVAGVERCGPVEDVVRGVVHERETVLTGESGEGRGAGGVRGPGGDAALGGLGGVDGGVRRCVEDDGVLVPRPGVDGRAVGEVERGEQAGERAVVRDVGCVLGHGSSAWRVRLRAAGRPADRTGASSSLDTP